jgi:hypothetical protein
MQQGNRQPMKDRDIEPAPNQNRPPVVIPPGLPPFGPTPPPIATPKPAIVLPLTGKNPYDP